MYIDITNTTLTQPSLYLCKPNREIIYNLTEAHNRKHPIVLGQIGELSFSLPYQIDQNHILVDAPYIPYIKHRYLIKYVFGTHIEWFMINIPTNKADTDDSEKTVECFSLGYELKDKTIREYNETSLNATQVLVDVLSDTIWNVGYVSATFDLMYRSFEIGSTITVLDMVFQIAETFGGIIKWDTINRTVSLYTYDEIGINKDLIFDYGKYIRNIEDTIDPEDFCTRLYIYGKDGTTINSINPTGTSYIENYDYFIYPFTRDENKVVLTHSDYMSDGLCNALLDYNILVDTKKNIFSNLLEQLELLQEDLTVKEGELTDLKGELTSIEDELYVAQSTDKSTTTILERKSVKEQEIAYKEVQISVLESSITLVENDITALGKEISIESNFTPNQIIELNQFIIVKEVSNEYISDAKQLLTWGEAQLLKITEPTIDIKISVVNFLQCLDPECITDSVKLSLYGGDIVTVKYDKFNINVKATITEINLDYESDDISLTISNIKDIKKDEDKFLKKLKKSISTSAELSMNKYKWNGIESTANDVSLLIEGLLDTATQTLKASINEYVDISRQGIILTDPTDPARLIRLTHGILGCSKTGGDSFSTAISADGVIAERIIGQILIGQNLIIDATNDEGTKYFRVDETGVYINGLALTIEGGDFGGTDPNAVHFDQQYNSLILSANDGIKITNVTNKKSRIILNAADVDEKIIKIQKSSDLGVNWDDVLYTNADGDLYLVGNMTGGTISIGSGNTIFKADTNGIYLGNATYASSPFRVSPAGSLYATDADIQGTIDCSDLLIDGESIYDIAQSMIDNATFKEKVNSLGLELVDPSHPTNKMYLQRKMLGTPPVDHGVEVLVTDGVHSFNMYTDDTVPTIPTFNLGFDNVPFIKRDLVDNTVYAEGTWSFKNTIVESDHFFEHGSIAGTGGSIDFLFENKYLNNSVETHPTYVLTPSAVDANVLEEEGTGYAIGIHLTSSVVGVIYNMIAFCSGKVPVIP